MIHGLYDVTVPLPDVALCDRARVSLRHVRITQPEVAYHQRHVPHQQQLLVCHLLACTQKLLSPNQGFLYGAHRHHLHPQSPERACQKLRLSGGPGQRQCGLEHVRELRRRPASIGFPGRAQQDPALQFRSVACFRGRQRRDHAQACFQVCNSFCQRHPGERILASFHPIRRSLLEPPCLRVMMGKHFGLGVLDIREALLDLLRESWCAALASLA